MDTLLGGSIAMVCLEAECCVCAHLQVLVLGNKNDLPNALRETELIERL